MLYSIVIIDDDFTIRKGLSKNIRWEDNGLQLKGTASDGEEGLKLIEDTRPDIVISDIRIPFFTGLEITQIAKEKYPDMKVILLTGYDDFKYAQEALRLRAYDYIMKPVDNAVLLDTVKRAVNELENEKNLKQQIVESMPLLRQRFLLELIGGKFKKEDEIESSMKFLGIPLKKGDFIVMVVKPDDYFAARPKVNVLEHEMLKTKVLNKCNEVLAGTEAGITFDSGLDEIVVLLANSFEDTDGFIRNSSNIAENIREKIRSSLKTTVTIGMGMPYRRFTDIARSFFEARSAVEYRHIYGRDQFLFIKDTGFPGEDEYIDISGRNIDILLKVKLGMTNDALDIVSQIEDEFIQRGFASLNYLRLIAIEITIMVMKNIEGRLQESNPSDCFQNFYEICNEIYDMQTVHEIFARVKKLVSDISSSVADNRETQQKKVVRKAAEYIENQYIREGLSLNDVAGNVHVNPTYLSILFKKEMSINFSDFVLNTRMNKAKELLRDTCMKTYEVAERVGYNNPQYFSVCFKKHTGLAPQDFKKQC